MKRQEVLDTLETLFYGVDMCFRNSCVYHPGSDIPGSAGP